MSKRVVVVSDRIRPCDVRPGPVVLSVAARQQPALHADAEALVMSEVQQGDEQAEDTEAACGDPTAASTTATPSGSGRLIRVVHISDTHGKRYDIPGGDVLIHSGDFTNHGVSEGPDEIRRFLEWWDALASKFKYRVLVPGNHEFGMDRIPYFELCELLHSHTHNEEDLGEQIPSAKKTKEKKGGPSKKDTTVKPGFSGVDLVVGEDGTIVAAANAKRTKTTDHESENSLRSTSFVLVDSSVSLFGGVLKIYGSPWTNCMMAWNMATDGRKEIFGKIPKDVDILVTHSPPNRTLDSPARLGCRMLAAYVDQIQPPLHLFGHVHCGNGIQRKKKGDLCATTYSNAAMEDQENCNCFSVVLPVSVPDEQ